jgi:cell division protein FtsB
MAENEANSEEVKTQPATRPGRGSPRRRSGRVSGVQIMFAAILAIGMILAINFSTRIAASRPLQTYYASVAEEIERLKQEQATLMAERDYVQSDAYVELWARADGKMVRPGEVLVVPLPAGARQQPTPIPPSVFAEVETSPPGPQTWHLWWSLFFDTSPPQF